MKKQLISLTVAAGLVVGLAAPAAAYSPSNSTKYIVSLGDSRASGYGLNPLESTSAEDTACWRSTKAAVNYMSYESNPTVTRNVACSGATAVNIWAPQQASDLGATATVPAQISTIPNSAFNNGKTTLTVQFGPNDVHWGQWLGKCFYDTCGTAEDTATFDALVAAYQANLTKGLGMLNKHPSKMQILVGGVYNPFINAYVAQFYAGYGLTAEEYAWAEAAVNKLNTATETAAVANGVTYVPIVFTNPAELQQPNEVPEGVAPFHPTELGQQTTARAFMNAMR